MFSRFISTLAFLISHGVVCERRRKGLGDVYIVCFFCSVFPVHGSSNREYKGGGRLGTHPNSHSFQSSTHRSGNQPEPRDLACASFVESFSNFKQKITHL